MRIGALQDAEFSSKGDEIVSNQPEPKAIESLIKHLTAVRAKKAAGGIISIIK